MYMNINAALLQYDVFVCSPTITAGPSFEHVHFHHVVQYAANAGRYGCTVDAAIQQLRRVRQVGVRVGRESTGKGRASGLGPGLPRNLV